MLGEPPHVAVSVAAEARETERVNSEVATEEQSRVAGQQASNGVGGEEAGGYCASEPIRRSEPTQEEERGQWSAVGRRQRSAATLYIARGDTRVCEGAPSLED